MKNRQYVLGIDTSNYKTSVAVVDPEGRILCDFRKLLAVKQGERGLRQSEAIFQHMENLPGLLSQALGSGLNEKIQGIAYAARPRPACGSYMPVFRAGEGFARSIAAALAVPCYGFSHQEGHLESIRYYSSFKEKDRLLCYHLSGGTCELLRVEGDTSEIIGGSKDISFGQVIDRIGVAMGMQFPAGEEMDEQALIAEHSTHLLKDIPLDGLFINLSGIETQCSRAIKENHQELIKELFDKITKVLINLTERAAQETDIRSVMFSGGVAASKYISQRIGDYFLDKDINIEFGRQELSQDNGVGIALLGGKQLWR